MRKVDAEGTGKKGGAGYGEVEMKVGSGSVVSTGTRWVGAFNEDPPAPVKFRVWDIDYRDNQGEYQLFIMVIPSAVVPDPKKVESD